MKGLSGFGKGDRIYPVVTLVFYYDTKAWDGAKDLYDMMGFTKEAERYPALRQFVPNYHINLIDAGRIKNPEIFRTDLHEVLGMLKYRGDKAGLQNYIKENAAYFSDLDRDSYYAVGTFLKSKRLLKAIEKTGQRKEEHLDMCKALDDL